MPAVDPQIEIIVATPNIMSGRVGYGLRAIGDHKGSPVGDAQVEVVVAGLTGPRGFLMTDDGTLYLALAGHGGETEIPFGPGFTYQVGLTSTISRVADGCATPFVAALPSAS